MLKEIIEKIQAEERSIIYLYTSYYFKVLECNQRYAISEKFDEIIENLEDDEISEYVYKKIKSMCSEFIHRVNVLETIYNGSEECKEHAKALANFAYQKLIEKQTKIKEFLTEVNKLNM